jgi:uncharacterized protein
MMQPMDASNVSQLWWALVAALVLVGLAGTVLPALPGVVLVFAGVLLAAWIDNFQRIGVSTVVVCAVLTVVAFALDYAASLMGAKRVKASRDAIIGAVVGTVAGLAMGIVGVLFMPLVGAAIGEYLATRNQKRALQVGVGTWLGTMVGLVGKVVIAFMLVGIMAVALWV